MRSLHRTSISLVVAALLPACGDSGPGETGAGATSASASATSASTSGGSSGDASGGPTTTGDGGTASSGDASSATSGADTTGGVTTTTTQGTGGSERESDTSPPGQGACGSDDPAPGLWCPPPGTSWQWQIDGEAIDTSFDVAMYDVDLFELTDAELATLKGAGRAVICYFSAGSYEEWRPDAGDFPMAALGDPLDGWPGERWLDIRDPGVRAVQAARMDLAQSRGCDGVEPDNVDGFLNATGFPLSADDQLEFNLWLASEAHARGLSVGLKNDLEQIPELSPAFDWALDEECAAYDECDLLSPFIDQGKAVFHVEYVDDIADGPALADAVCPGALALGFSTLIKEWSLGPWRIACG
ncbi:MAG: endo alpha-1,4 polygalactosaminidase [Myxococcales bacterium]|nr:endo alpha-1,4 polygalactosaminidase [Myxococcales bacterium]